MISLFNSSIGIINTNVETFNFTEDGWNYLLKY